MDYKEKYEQALKTAKLLADNTDNEVYKKKIEAIFPELSESEDERIRKWIINEIKIKHHNLDEDNVNFVDKAIAWLGKQGKKRSCRNCQTFQDLHQNCPYSPIYGYTDLEEAHKHLDDETNCKFWLKKQKDQKATWSEEDEQMLHKALSTIRYALSIPIDKEDEPCFVGSSTISWLKSLKDRITLTNKNDFDRGYEVGISAAKFNQWKPTDEQMDAIREAVLEMGKCNSPCNIEVFHNIKSLYEDLKKL